MTLDGTNGDLTVLTDGDYQHLITISFSGNPSAVIGCDLYVNGSKEVVLFHRMLNSLGDVGSASSTAIRALSSGDVVSWHFYSDVDASFLSITAMRVSLLKLN